MNNSIEMPLATVDSMKTWAFEHSDNAMLLTNLKHEILAVNSVFLEWFEFTEEEVIGKNAGDALRSKSLGPELYKQIPEALDKRGSWQGEVINRSKNGNERICLLSVSAISSPEGEKIGYLGVNIDLSDKKRLEEEIAHSERLSNIGESVATLMHEVRNPLSGIAMNVFMLENSAAKGNPWSEGDHESLQLISKEVKRLDLLVRNALSYAREMHIYPERVNIENFLEDVRELVGHNAQKAFVDVHIKPFEEELTALLDMNSMKQVLLNLVHNAIDAAMISPEKSVRLGARIGEHEKWRSISSSARVLLINVDNSGHPISEERTQKLFKPFFTSKKSGIGLGLATASKIVRQHHGLLNHYQITEDPYYTRFTVILPI